MKKADYGVDAPGVVRNLFLVAIAGFLIWFTAKLGWWSGDVTAFAYFDRFERRTR